MKTRILLVLSLFFFFGCATNKLNNKLRQEINDVSVISLIGPAFYVDTIGTTIFQNKELSFDVSSWQINEQLKAIFKKNLHVRNKKYIDVQLDEAAVRAAMTKQKESGRPLFGFSEAALRDLGFIASEKSGAKYMFLVTSLERHDSYLLYRGPMGMICYDRKLRNTHASPYFLYQLSFWDVQNKKKIFQTTVNPRVTEDIDPIQCSALKNIKEAAVLSNLKTNVSDALERSVQYIFTKMEW